MWQTNFSMAFSSTLLQSDLSATKYSLYLSMTSHGFIFPFLQGEVKSHLVNECNPITASVVLGCCSFIFSAIDDISTCHLQFFIPKSNDDLLFSAVSGWQTFKHSYPDAVYRAPFGLFFVLWLAEYFQTPDYTLVISFK